MYVDAIEKAAQFTRPIFFISRTYGSAIVQPGAATIFFVNADGWAVTCGHVADQIMATDHINERYRLFKGELGAYADGKKAKQVRRELERKYHLDRRELAQMKVKFVDCLDSFQTLTMQRHKTYDIALLKFEGFEKLLCTEFPVFAPDSGSLKPGKSLCRLGFPFVEFTDFGYDPDRDEIEWTQTGQHTTPRFPIEGMVTRHLIGQGAELIGFEMSTPGLRGQSGGPAFDSQGRVWGIQSMTGHLDLDFDVDQQVRRQGLPKRVQDSAFLHVGGCVHIQIIKEFMRSLNVTFVEG
ncbi:MAG: trypsin-like peptidase domain-containing protein [Acidobacteria bacterium]|nr:trypsin-like peptidase domain-containing protein [Acidobacteriota bacterium]